MPFEAVLLDAAGTLIRPRQPVGETYAAMAGRFGVELDPAALSQAFVQAFEEMPDLAFDWTSTDELGRLERNWWRTLVCRVFDAMGGRVGDFEALFDTLYAHYVDGEAWECFPEVTAVLKALRSRGCRLAVLSNFDSRLPQILQDLGLRDLTDAVIYSSKAGSAKPDPVIFRKALAALRVAPERAVHVGDSVRADLEGAAAAGIAGLLVRRDLSPSVGAGSVIGSLQELLVRLDADDLLP